MFLNIDYFMSRPTFEYYFLKAVKVPIKLGCETGSVVLELFLHTESSYCIVNLMEYSSITNVSVIDSEIGDYGGDKSVCLTFRAI